MGDIALFTSYGLDYLFRWGHFMAGITWIGVLYYFNFIQGEYFKEAEDAHRSGAIQKLVPRALWWFRWGAMFTFLTGVVLLGFRHSGISYDITVGATLGTLMFLNVWLIIWPAQKIVIASEHRLHKVAKHFRKQQGLHLKRRWPHGPMYCFLHRCSFSWVLRAT